MSLGVICQCRKLIRHCFVIFPLNAILERLLIFSYARLITQDKNVIFNIKKWGILRCSCWWFSCSLKSISEINLIAVICLKLLICWWVVFFTFSLVILKEYIHVKYQLFQIAWSTRNAFFESNVKITASSNKRLHIVEYNIALLMQQHLWIDMVFMNREEWSI